jgi:hypothetical protein
VKVYIVSRKPIGRMKNQYIPPAKPLLLIRCPNTNEKLWWCDGPTIRITTIATTPPVIHHTETRFSNATSGEEKTLIRPCRTMITTNSANVWWRIDDRLVVPKLRMKFRP